MGGLLSGLQSAAEETYDGVAQIGDAGAGSIDEAAGNTTGALAEGDWAGAFDGTSSLDEAVGEMTSGDVAGVFDGALGSFDEGTGEGTQGTATILDAFGGSGDESVGHQFDDQPGGGFADDAGEWTEDAAADAWDWTVDAADNAAQNLDPFTPGWFDWLADNQEAVMLGVVVLAFAYATQGTVSVGGAS